MACNNHNRVPCPPRPWKRYPLLQFRIQGNCPLLPSKPDAIKRFDQTLRELAQVNAACRQRQDAEIQSLKEQLQCAHDFQKETWDELQGQKCQTKAAFEHCHNQQKLIETLRCQLQNYAERSQGPQCRPPSTSCRPQPRASRSPSASPNVRTSNLRPPTPRGSKSPKPKSSRSISPSPRSLSPNEIGKVTYFSKKFDSRPFHLHLIPAHFSNKTGASITKDLNPSADQRVPRGSRVDSINGRDVTKMKFKAIRALLKKTTLPTTVKFKVPDGSIASSTNV